MQTDYLQLRQQDIAIRAIQTKTSCLQIFSASPKFPETKFSVRVSQPAHCDHHNAFEPHIQLELKSETILDKAVFHNLVIMTTMTFCMSPINAESKVEMEEEEEVNFGNFEIFGQIQSADR